MKAIGLIFLFAAACAAQVTPIVTPSIGGFTLPAGGCFTQAVTMTGAAVGSVPVPSPRTFPGNGVTWQAYVTSANHVTVKICAMIAGFVAASVYDVTVPGTGSGTVTTVTATLPIESTGGATPVISCPTCSTSGGGGTVFNLSLNAQSTHIPATTLVTCTGASDYCSYLVTVKISCNQADNGSGTGTEIPQLAWTVNIDGGTDTASDNFAPLTGLLLSNCTVANSAVGPIAYPVNVANNGTVKVNSTNGTFGAGTRIDFSASAILLVKN